MKTTRIPESNCPTCNHKLNAVSDCINQNVPKPGDISMCIKCGQMLEFSDDLTQIHIKPKTLEELKKDPETWAIIVKYQETINKR